MGKKLFTGNFNLINTPFPVVMFEPRSYLEKLADVWVYPHFLLQASQTKDPVHRMKLVMTWFVAGLHHGFEKWKKPFNPILGETWQAELADGSSMFLEQISHHPPITAFNLEGPGGAYKFNGLSQPNVSLLLKHSGIRTVAKGYRYIVFADGCRIDLHYPGIKGVVYASRPRAEVEGSAVFVDAKNQLHGVLRFGGRKSARLPVMRRSDAVHGGIYDMRGLQQQASSPINPPTLAAEDSCSSEGAEGGWPPGATPGPPSGPNHLAPIQGDGESEGEEGFESASESEWEAGELSNVQPNGVEPSPPPPAAGGPL
ncbi:oxysterol-binding protein 9, partial [Haematococcus lacustris]